MSRIPRNFVVDYLTRPRPPPDTHVNTSTFTTHCTQLQQQQQQNLSRPFAYTHASPFTRRVSYACRHADWWYSASRILSLSLSLSDRVLDLLSEKTNEDTQTGDRNLGPITPSTATIHRTMARVFPRAPKIACTGGGQAITSRSVSTLEKGYSTSSSIQRTFISRSIRLSWLGVRPIFLVQPCAEFYWWRAAHIAHEPRAAISTAHIRVVS